MEEECCRNFKVVMSLGLHARSAAILVRTAHLFRAEIAISHEGTTVCGKSLLSLMILAAGAGAKLRVVARGPDAREAMEAIGELFLSGFGEFNAEIKPECLRALPSWN